MNTAVAMNNVTSFVRRENTARSGAAGPNALRVHLFGTMRVLASTGEDILPRARKTQAVLGYLCLARNEPVTRSRLAGVIWDRANEGQARDSLRHALTEIENTESWRLEKGRHTVRLDTAPCWIDVFENPQEPDLLLEGLRGVSSGFDHWLL